MLSGSCSYKTVGDRDTPTIQCPLTGSTPFLVVASPSLHPYIQHIPWLCYMDPGDVPGVLLTSLACHPSPAPDPTMHQQVGVGGHQKTDSRVNILLWCDIICMHQL